MNKATLVIMIIALAGGAFVGLAMMGTIDVPGLSPTKKKAGAQAVYAADKEGKIAGATQEYAGDKDGKAPPAVEPVKPAAQRPASPSAVRPPAKPKAQKSAFTIDPEAGRKKVAKLWNEMSVASLGKVVAAYKGPDLPRILAIMDPSKVAKLLEGMEAPEAAKLSKQIQQVASKVKTPG